MDIRSILVPLGNAATDSVVLRHGLSVARRMDAHMQATFVEASASLRGAFHGQAAEAYLTEDMVASMRASALRHREATHALFAEMTAAEGVPQDDGQGNHGQNTDGPSASWRVVTGDVIGIITQEASVHDLVVLAGPSSASGGSAAAEVDGVLLATGRPTLLATGAPGAGDIVLVGWNRSLQSGRALTEGLPFMRRASRVHLLQVDTGAKTGPGVDRAARYLAQHGIAADVRTVASGSGNVGEVLLEQVADVRADLLIMGAYSRSRLRELLLGGVTRHVVAHAPVPVLMVH